MTTSSTVDAQATESGALTHKQIVTILTGLMLAMFLAALDQTIVSTAIRTISDDLHGFSLQVWATTAFLITSTISTPLYGKLSDMYGRKPFILFAISIFIVGSMLCGLSQSMYELAAFRAIQGIGAGGLFSLSLAIIGDIVSPRERPKYQGYFLAVFATSSVLGPVLGGFFAGSAEILGIPGWRWIFYINIPIAAAALIVVTKVLHAQQQRRAHRIDWPGALALIVCLVPLLIVAEQGSSWGWGSGTALTCYLIGAVGLIGFLFVERQYGDEALLPMRLFHGRTFSVAVTTSFLIGTAMFGAILLLPLYLQVVKGASPTRAGLEILPLVLGMMVGSIVAGQTITRTGRYKVFPIIGGALMIIAMALFSRLTADTSFPRVFLPMVLMGLGLGGSMQPMVTAAQNAASPREIGVATSSVTFFRSMGGTIGAAVFLSILFSRLPGKIQTAYADAANEPAFRAAAAAHPDQVTALQKSSGGSSSLQDTSFLNHLASALAHPFKVGFAGSMSLVFYIAIVIMVATLIVTLFLPELPLSRQSAAEKIHQETSGAAAVGAVASTMPDTPQGDSAAAGNATDRNGSAGNASAGNETAGNAPAGTNGRGPLNGRASSNGSDGTSPSGTPMPGSSATGRITEGEPTRSRSE
jgi:EmrB/QacA subfamily drug resistance transporter